MEPERLLALRTSIIAKPNAVRPPAVSDGLWVFELRALPCQRTRLVVSTYSSRRTRLPVTLLNLLFWEPAHFIMQTRQFSNLRCRVEGEGALGRSRASRAGLPTRVADDPSPQA